jgi:3-oxoadipyl-CoA thiolase
MQEAFILDYIRTPIGRYGGALAQLRPDDLLASTIKAILERNPWLDQNQVDDIIAGAANQSGEDNRNVARMAGLLAGMPISVPGTTVNRLCASGLQAIADAARAIKAGDGQLYLAGGVESMSRAPFVMPKAEKAYDRPPVVYDTTLGWRFTNPALAANYEPISMGETAENVAEQFNISRADQDAYALQSQSRFAAALVAGKPQAEILPQAVRNGKEMSLVASDEHPRETSLEKLSALKPVFRTGGSVTPGNAAGLNDGAAMTIIASGEIVKKHGLKPMAKVVACVAAGVHPSIMGIGPVPAITKLLVLTGLSMADIGLVEINEAFAAQVLASQRELGIDMEKLNVNGGAIALGHPLGMSGARLTGSLALEMRRRNVRYGISSMCIGVGQGMAALLELAD